MSDYPASFRFSFSKKEGLLFQPAICRKPKNQSHVLYQHCQQFFDACATPLGEILCLCLDHNGSYAFPHYNGTLWKKLPIAFESPAPLFNSPALFRHSSQIYGLFPARLQGKAILLCPSLLEPEKPPLLIDSLSNSYSSFCHCQNKDTLCFSYLSSQEMLTLRFFNLSTFQLSPPFSLLKGKNFVLYDMAFYENNIFLAFLAKQRLFLLRWDLSKASLSNLYDLGEKPDYLAFCPHSLPLCHTLKQGTLCQYTLFPTPRQQIITTNSSFVSLQQIKKLSPTQETIVSCGILENNQYTPLTFLVEHS